MRADLQALIDYTGLTIGEAAAVIGIGHDAVSKKLAGADRYPARQSDIDPLAALAELQDRAVATTLNEIDRLNKLHPPVEGEAPNNVVLLSYRKTEDMLPGEEWPTATAQRMVLARVKAQVPIAVELVMFDRDGYEKWRAGRQDTRAARLEWADLRAQQGVKFALKWGTTKSQQGKDLNHALGWAVWKIGPEHPETTQVKVGEGSADIPRP